jgi:hypothetical protein
MLYSRCGKCTGQQKGSHYGTNTLEGGLHGNKMEQLNCQNFGSQKKVDITMSAPPNEA